MLLVCMYSLTAQHACWCDMLKAYRWSRHQVRLMDYLQSRWASCKFQSTWTKSRNANPNSFGSACKMIRLAAWLKLMVYDLHCMLRCCLHRKPRIEPSPCCIVSHYCPIISPVFKSYISMTTAPLIIGSHALQCSVYSAFLPDFDP